MPPASASLEDVAIDEKVALGRLLFYDPIVSSDGTVACATCHSEIWGMSDGLPRSIGVGGSALAGPGRVGENVTRRNSQALWNVAFKDRFFWDGRAESLEAQALFPFDAEEELDRAPEAVAADLGRIEEYANRFAKAFPGGAPAVTVEHMTAALAAFQRTLVSESSLYDSYVAGDEHALSEEMKRGMFLFAEAGCDSCHAPPLFTNGAFVRRGVEALPGVEDLGRYEVTDDPDDLEAFAVPTLRNVRETSPYFHTGAVRELSDAIARELAYSVEHDGLRDFTSKERDALIEFVSKALVDRSADPSRPKTVPSGLPVPLDNTRLLR